MAYFKTQDNHYYESDKAWAESCVKVSKDEYKKGKDDAIINDIKKYMRNKKRKTIYTSCEHVSSSGMTRHIKLFVTYKNELINITWSAAQLMGYSLAKDGGLIVTGCGMDMGFHVVYSLSRKVYNKDGYKINHSWI